MNSALSLNNGPENKKFWQKPENLFIYGGLGLLGYGVLKALDVLLPLLNRVLENLLYTSLLAAGVGVVAILVFSKDLHKIGWWAWKMAMKKFTGWFIDIDPIAILNGYVDSLKAKLAEIGKALGELRGQRLSLMAQVRNDQEAYNDCMMMIQQAKKIGTPEMKLEMQLKSREAMRLDGSIKTFQNLLGQIDAHIKLNEKFKQGSEFWIRDIESTVDTETKKRKAIHSSFKAMKASKRILMADEQREMWDLALQSVQADYNSKLGEIDQFINDTKSVFNGIDLQNGAYEDEALKRLELWEQKSDQLFTDKSGKPILALPASTTVFDSMSEADQLKSEYSKLFQ